MNKELTPLEALCYLDDIAHGRKMCYDPHSLKLLIEGTLRKHEAILNAIPQEIRSIDELQSMANWFYNNDYKKLKAFKIIKEKIVDVYIILKANSLDEYNKWYVNVQDNFIPLTQEEFDLLKEVLL